MPLLDMTRNACTAFCFITMKEDIVDPIGEYATNLGVVSNFQASHS
jgi:hypothetical protein